MHQDKTVTRILFIFLVANVALAAPAVARRHLDAVATSEKRWDPDLDSDDEATDNWAPASPAVSFHDGPPPPHQLPWWHWPPGPLFRHSWWLIGQDSVSTHDSAPQSTTGSSSHSGSVGSMPEPVSDSEESVHLPDDLYPYWTEPPDFGLASGDSGSDDSSHHLTQPPSPSGWNHDLTTPAWGASSSHYHSAAESVNLPTPGDSTPESAVPSTHYDSEPSEVESGTPSLHGDPVPEAADSSTHDDLAPLAHGDPVPEAMAPSAHDDSVPEAAAPPVRDDPAPEAVTSSVLDDPAPVAAAPSALGDPVADSGDPPSHLHPVPESSETASEAYGVFNDKLKQKIKINSALGAVSAGAIYGLKKIKNTVSSGVYVSPLFALLSRRHQNRVANILTSEIFLSEIVGGDLASSDAAGRAASTHPRPRK